MLLVGLGAVALFALFLWDARSPVTWGALIFAVAALAASYVLFVSSYLKLAAWLVFAATGIGAVPALQAKLQVTGWVDAEVVTYSSGTLAGLLVLAAMYCIRLEFLDRRGAAQTNPGENDAQPGIDRSAVGGGKVEAGRDIIHVGDGATFVQGNTTVKEALDKIEAQARTIERLESRHQQTEEENKSLRAAVERVQHEAEKGNTEAQAAIAVARHSGNAEQLQRLLIEFDDRIEKDVQDKAAEHVALCREIAAVAYLRGDLAEAEKRLNAILRFVPDDVDAINRLGHIHSTRGELDQAKECYERVLALSEDSFDAQAAAYGNLGLIYRARGELDQAEAMHRKALVIDEKLGRLEGMACQYGNLGLVYQDRGDLDQAEAMHRKALVIDEKLGGQEGMADDFGNLGLIYRAHGELDQAEAMQRKALVIDEKLGRLEGMASEYGNLGVIYGTRGELDQAEAMCRKALEINKKLGRLEGMANQYGNLGTVYELRGDFKKAREYWTQARDLFMQIGIPHRVEKVQRDLDGLPDGDAPSPDVR